MNVLGHLERLMSALNSRLHSHIRLLVSGNSSALLYKNGYQTTMNQKQVHVKLKIQSTVMHLQVPIYVVSSAN